MTHLAHAIDIATQAHRGQVDKVGRPYFEHCRRVSKAVEALDEKIVAYLHDVVEKGGWTFDRLREAGFGTHIVAAVDALTRRENESERSLVRRAVSNPLARPVKWADLIDNRRQALMAGKPTEKYDEGLALMGIEFEQGDRHGKAGQEEMVRRGDRA